jgi:hypothetical protein
VTVDKTVTVSAGAPSSSLADVFFLADTTGSMGGVISSVATSASAILAGTTGIGNVAWGVGDYKDIGDVYEYRLETPITTSVAAVQAGINTWYASGGGDYQESDLQGLYEAAQSGTGWRPGSARLLIWMGDASGHDPSGSLGITEAQATAALQSANIKTLAVDVGTLNDTGQATRIAAATGGAYYHGIDSASIVSTIESAITAAFSTYGTVSLDLSEAPAGVSVASLPGSYTGTYDRSVERTFDFDVTFTGVNPGTYDFKIYALVDGGRVATEGDHIQVGSTVPEPTSIVLLSTLLLGMGGLLRRRLG